MDEIDKHIREFMQHPNFNMLINSPLEFNPPVTLTYALERLMILHVKLWKLEDLVRDNNMSFDEIGITKRQIDYLNGVVRPRIVAAIGEIFAKAVKEGNEELVREPNLKNYKAR